MTMSFLDWRVFSIGARCPISEDEMDGRLVSSPAGLFAAGSAPRLGRERQFDKVPDRGDVYQFDPEDVRRRIDGLQRYAESLTRADGGIGEVAAVAEHVEFE